MIYKPPACTDLFRLSIGIGLQVKGGDAGDMGAGHGGPAGDDSSGVAVIHVTADCDARRVQRDAFSVVGVGPPRVILIRGSNIYYLRHSARTQLAGIYSITGSTRKAMYASARFALVKRKS